MKLITRKEAFQELEAKIAVKVPQTEQELDEYMSFAKSLQEKLVEEEGEQNGKPHDRN